jgi:hypothetical protein
VAQKKFNGRPVLFRLLRALVTPATRRPPAAAMPSRDSLHSIHFQLWRRLFMFGIMNAVIMTVDSKTVKAFDSRALP